jgi:hypothetical protein
MSLQELLAQQALLDEKIALARSEIIRAQILEDLAPLFAVAAPVPVPEPVALVATKVFAITSLPASYRREHGEKKWWAAQADGSPRRPEGPPLNGVARLTGGINEDLVKLLSPCRDEKTRKKLLRAYRVPAGREEWWTGKTDAEMSSHLPSQILKFYQLATSPDGTLFVLRAGADAHCVVEKAGSYSFLPGSKETHDKTLFQHGVPYKFVRMCTESEKKVACSRPTIVEHTIFC